MLPPRQARELRLAINALAKNLEHVTMLFDARDS